MNVISIGLTLVAFLMWGCALIMWLFLTAALLTSSQVDDTPKAWHRIWYALMCLIAMPIILILIRFAVGP